MAHHSFDTLGDIFYPPAVYPELGLRRIRVLRISRQYQSSAPILQDVISCTMIEVSLDKDTSQNMQVYDAVSYAWGSWDDSRIIIVNGFPLAVTKNLHEALLLFRQDYSVERWLWVDAICINQRNSDERSRQVAMMGEIFRHAATVRVWVGSEAKWTGFCLDELAEFVAEPELEDLSRLVTPGYLLESDEFYLGLKDLSERRWWRRLWCVQEVVLAEHVTVHCGMITMDFRLLVARLYVFWCSLLQTVAAPERASSRMRSKGLSIQRLTAFYEICGEFLPFISVFLRTSDLSTDEGAPKRVNEHLAIISSMQATLPRDRIYGLLGLLPRTLVFAIGIDYTTPAHLVYEEAATEIMAWSSSLDLLGLIDTSPKPASSTTTWSSLHHLPHWLRQWLPNTFHPAPTPEIAEANLVLPSWVPKWNSPTSLHNPSFWNKSFHAASAIPPVIRHPSRGTLIVRALVIDRLFAVSLTCPAVSYAEQVAGVPRQEVIDVLHQWRNLFAIMNPHVPEEQQILPFWRTLTMDRIFQSDLLSRRRWSEEDFFQGLMLETWLRHPSSLELFANVASRNRIRSNLLGGLAGRTFCITAGKRAAVVQCDGEKLREDDVIALLAGLHMPAILRQVEGGYVFVAPCYVDGVMYGEAAAEGTEHRFEEMTLV